MKKVFKFTNLLMLTLLLTTYSCGDDDDDEVNVINVQNLEVTIDENPTNGAIVGTVTTTQTVGGGTLAYSITTQTPTGALNIDATTGELTVADATLFDFETNPVLTATVEVAGTTNTGTVTINLNDLNEIGIQDLNVTIDENPTAGQAIGTVLTSGTGSIDFSITSATPAGAMSIDASTGELTVADVTLFDFERNPIITAVISSVGTLSTGTVTINLNDLNEVGVQDLTVTIDENPTVGQVIGTVLTSGTGSIDFSITSATPAGAMSIDASTGELTVLDATLFDFEINPTITAVVSSAGALNTGTVTINLNDLNEISAQDLTVTIDENPTTGQAVGTIQVTGGGTLSFSITSQTPAGALNINASTGELTVADPNLFDFETTPVITADISVNNSVSTATAIATINLNDVDEISVQALTVEMDENPTSGQVIGTLQATSSEILSYTITYQNPAGAFDINSSTGELTVDDASLFDFETNPNMLATISVDNGVYSVSANAYIDLNDLNEAAAIGDFRDGGIVFWVDPADNTHGLVTTVSDLNSGNSITWNNGTNVPGAEATAIGSGQANTTAIVAAQATGTYAASLCDNLSLGSYNDWFLPSSDELYQIYLNKTIINTTSVANGGANLNTLFYWTSTQDSGNANLAYILRISNGNIEVNNKLNVAWVRAIRAF